MSEINSIANGSFVLGQTSATNFVAGPGIKIDQPSEGVVRIGNDETVLWENPGADSRTNTKDINWSNQTLSELPSNFERIVFVYSTDQVTAPKFYEFLYMRDNDLYIMEDYTKSSSNDYYFLRVAAFRINGKNITNEWNITRNFNLPTNNGNCTSNGDGTGYSIITKIIGLNRISGSNA